MDSVPVGRQQVTFFHAQLDSAGVGAPVFDIEVRAADENRVVLATPSAGSLRQALCPKLVDPALGVLIGRVRDVDTGNPIPEALVATSWMEVVLSASGPSAERHQVTTSSLGGGLYALCGIPIDVPVFVRASVGNQASGPVEVYGRDHEVAFQQLAVSLRDTTARLSVDSLLNAATTNEPRRPAGMARVLGRVRDMNGRPIRGARISLHGGSEVAVAGDTGGFRLAGLPGGRNAGHPGDHSRPPGGPHCHRRRLARRRRARPPGVEPSCRWLAGRAIDGFAERSAGLGHYMNAERIRRMVARPPWTCWGERPASFPRCAPSRWRRAGAVSRTCSSTA